MSTVYMAWLFQYKRWNFQTKRLAFKTYPRETQLFPLESAGSWQRVLIAESRTEHEAIWFSYPVDLVSCTWMIGMGLALECMQLRIRTSLAVTTHKVDTFILNCCPTVPVGCEERVGNVKCTRRFLPLVKGLAPRLSVCMQSPSC